MIVDTILNPQLEDKPLKKPRKPRKTYRTDLQKLRQKEYSRINRRRKKKYFQELEQKVQVLEDEVKRLNHELWKERNHKTVANSGFVPAATQLVDSEAIIRDAIIQRNEENIEHVFREDLKQVIERTLPKGDDWLRQLKYHFDAISESIFLSPHKLIFFICQNLSKKSSHSYEQV